MNRSVDDNLYKQIKPEFLRSFPQYHLSQEVMEDIYHDAFQAYLDACRAGRFDPDKGTPQQYIFRAGRNICLKQRKRSSRTTLLDHETLEILRLHQGPGDSTREEIIHLVRKQLLPVLSAEEQEMIWRFYGEGWKIQEIADAMEITEGTVKMRKKRIIKQLLKLINRHPPFE